MISLHFFFSLGNKSNLNLDKKSNAKLYSPLKTLPKNLNGLVIKKDLELIIFLISLFLVFKV
jgi:hypothetical protein